MAAIKPIKMNPDPYDGYYGDALTYTLGGTGTTFIGPAALQARVPTFQECATFWSHPNNVPALSGITKTQQLLLLEDL